MLFTLEALPAKEGDCLLLHWGTRKAPNVAVIDGGPGRVYETDLRPRLEEIARNLGRDELVLPLVMVSHMDRDHIVGIRKLFSEVRRELGSQASADARFRVERLWLNIFNDILGDALDQYYRTLPKNLQASVDGQPSAELVAGLEENFAEKMKEDDAAFYARDVAAVLAGSYGEGRQLRDDHRFLFEQGQTATLNSPFTQAGGRATLITLEKTKKPIELSKLKIRIIGPMQDQIDALQKDFDVFVKKNGPTTEAVLAAYADESITNLSSIVCLAELGKKRILLTGDARGDHIIEGLRRQKLLDENGQLFVDILKVPHHGSDRNVEPEFFETIVADTYVLSGDGVHGNPDRETLQWILDARGPKAKFDLVLTYDIEHIDEHRKEDLEKKQKKKPPAKREKWDHDAMSLAAFFDATSDYAYTLYTGARRIDLGKEGVDY